MPFFQKITEHRHFKISYENTLEDHGKALAVYYYSKVPNWGDTLNKYLLEKISGAPVVLCKSRTQQHVVGVGSIVNKANANSVVWGAGLAKPEHIRKASPGQINCVRGPLTRNVLQKGGYSCPEVYGDPCILLRRYYQPKCTEKRYKLGIIPHIADKNHPLVTALGQCPEVKVIDIQQDIEPFIDDLVQCDVIASSSLHGIIAADTYGIANTHLVLSDNLAGGEFKFNDYHLGIGVHDYPRFDARTAAANALTAAQIIQSCRKKAICPSIEEKLLAAFPSDVVERS